MVAFATSTVVGAQSAVIALAIDQPLQIVAGVGGKRIAPFAPATIAAFALASLDDIDIALWFCTVHYSLLVIH